VLVRLLEVPVKLVDWTIAGIVGVAVGHNVVAAGRGKQLVCERVDDYRAAHWWVTNTVLTLLYLHLMRQLPYDPLTKLSERVERMFAQRRR
jgi:hypothetical protein